MVGYDACDPAYIAVHIAIVIVGMCGQNGKSFCCGRVTIQASENPFAGILAGGLSGGFTGVPAVSGGVYTVAN